MAFGVAAWGMEYQMFAPILVAFLVIPLVELYVLFQVADLIGGLPTVIALIAISILGARLMKREGRATWQRLNAALARGEVPTKEVTDGAMILFGGALMLTPGFITDIFGLLLLLPPTRAALKGAFRKLLGAFVLGRAGAVGKVGRGVYAARVVSSRRKAKRTPADVTPVRETPNAHPLEHRAGADDSPDRG
jgi:UPF0716 protein FxsA